MPRPGGLKDDILVEFSICGGVMFQDVREILQEARFDLYSCVPALVPTGVLRAHLTGIRGSCSCERRTAVSYK
jgi:hypothetical protein